MQRLSDKQWTAIEHVVSLACAGQLDFRAAISHLQRIIDGNDLSIKEENNTGNLDGGEGQPQVATAFSPKGSSRGIKVGKASKSYTEMPPKEHRWGIKWEGIIKTLEDLQEMSYRDFRTTEGTDKTKINLAIKEAYRKILEAEKIVNNASKLKLEAGADQGVFWKQSGIKFHKLAERLNRLGTKLRELNK